jgi:hypothetical protein
MGNAVMGDAVVGNAVMGNVVIGNVQYWATCRLSQAVKYTSTKQRSGVVPNHKHVEISLVKWN